ncbi:unnamed protein product [Darwinula stevensoni]|uniref:Uncharacterized protein n=1 Tax=Darwinula stevensoni TaxID=69355 RepID=A0A7R9A3Y5_9CRUS|nr:unnamed protein product [Darwinula stevensoni]CAG0883126.1 unnamed protein product [Darwinula stevensoni]
MGLDVIYCCCKFQASLILNWQISSEADVKSLKKRILVFTAFKHLKEKLAYIPESSQHDALVFDQMSQLLLSLQKSELQLFELVDLEKSCFLNLDEELTSPLLLEEMRRFVRAQSFKIQDFRILSTMTLWTIKEPVPGDAMDVTD